VLFLQAAQPTYAVCSEGAGNSYGHPHPETLLALVNAGATVFRTDLNGTITFITDGTTLSVQEER
jgi:competence protein ComEC